MDEREQTSQPKLSFSIDNILRDDFPKSSRISRPSVCGTLSRAPHVFRGSMAACHECYSARYRPIYIYTTPSSIADKEAIIARGARSHSLNQTNCAGKLERVTPKNTQQGNPASSSKNPVNDKPNNTEVYCKQESDENKTTPDQSKEKKKRFRSHFSQLQLQYLENIFSRQHYLSRDERTLLANALDMTELQVRNWFQNKRYQKRHREIQALQKVVKQVPVKILVSDRSPVIPALGVRPGEMRY